jgi:uncharacterized protein YdhG (YjbR/CyaY superfamily)
MNKKTFRNIDEYIMTLSNEMQLTLQDIRKLVHEIVPDVTETISYQMPTFKLGKVYLLHVAAWKDHIGLYPTPDGITAFEEELRPYKSAKGSVRFPLNKPIPYELIRKIVRYKLAQAQKQA